MIKTLSKAQKMEREEFRIPRSVQDAIPIRRIFADGIFQVGNQYSKTWSFTDINYAIAGKEDKTSMFLDYSELLNALDSGASAKITIYNRRINKAEFERSVLLPDRDDGLDEYRHEFNRMLTAQVTGTSNSIVRERYLTVSVVKRNADEARSYFARVGTDLVTHLAQLFSVAQELTLTERLHIFRDFFKAGEQAAAEFNTESGNGTESAAAKTVTQTVLLIELTHKTPDEMAQDYAYTARQQEYLDLLRAPEYETLWAELLGGFLSGGGEILAPAGAWQSTGPLQWPLPITGSITSPFGYRTDPITGEVSYHSGTDIAAPAGTPILAAADGTVIVANGVDSWGGSYGYYVKLDHGGGLQTLYAHCQTICVTAGQQVQAGQVIGYVGHTGRATGDHLHFEIVENGQRQGRPS